MKIIKTCDHGIKNIDCEICQREDRNKKMREAIEQMVVRQMEADGSHK